MNRYPRTYPRTYSGERQRGIATVRVIGGDQTARPLHLHLSKCNHSPTGFEWGYSGSGPSQLAFEILYDVFDDSELALKLHQRFKREKIAKLERDEPWKITEGEVVTWAARVTKVRDHDD